MQLLRIYLTAKYQQIMRMRATLRRQTQLGFLINAAGKVPQFVCFDGERVSQAAGCTFLSLYFRARVARNDECPNAACVRADCVSGVATEITDSRRADKLRSLSVEPARNVSPRCVLYLERRRQQLDVCHTHRK